MEPPAISRGLALGCPPVPCSELFPQSEHRAPCGGGPSCCPQPPHPRLLLDDAHRLSFVGFALLSATASAALGQRKDAEDSGSFLVLMFRVL